MRISQLIDMWTQKYGDESHYHG